MYRKRTVFKRRFLLSRSAYAVLDAKKIQVQRHPHSSVSHEQAQEGTAEEALQGHEVDAVMAGDGHTDG
jgi:hypothetical protein